MVYLDYLEYLEIINSKLYLVYSFSFYAPRLLYYIILAFISCIHLFYLVLFIYFKDSFFSQ
ncbi:hypothetical protein GLOIN_2v1560482 [Rhizophagus irregularis DAOM 181602=DAOM 197198]|uniref:Uncharacterized protein n=1 Tax=Rhizophagus irregularis (strain DAOM 181602 / DAOM 197198 / MUCL 43194) TaxID=747089 RepID=A0A2P4QEA5_RHIID|nr:hypothetical protein GLOIN_2v1560482 [Rhizophagus irregularis DAOM 181602=DAOM 197198]POG75956.1 hypothetical protein GLOIN_2v1560482 [Rhizophagus irregularis DAOM 181602=DAOM 197198]|eukprot:XP_025182822.1 hypothetical protein GLOIN_2v1560482 [Rhizophagus irregularis DAOM 181602=DAOM 197198]